MKRAFMIDTNFDYEYGPVKMKPLRKRDCDTAATRQESAANEAAGAGALRKIEVEIPAASAEAAGIGGELGSTRCAWFDPTAS